MQPPAEGSAARVLVIPAAGMGTRLRSPLPKVLVPILGRPMLDWLLDLYVAQVERVVVVANPSSRTLVSEHLSRRGVPATVVVQEQPTGMLDAILLAAPVVEASAAGSVWITWCDQVGIHTSTIERLAVLSSAHPSAAIVMPTCTRPEPYIHFERDAAHRITRVLHRREGDAMPGVGEGDMGLFCLSRRAFVEELPRYAANAERGAATGERNFLPFIARAEHLGGVVTYPCVDPEESIGVNTPEEVVLLERYLQARTRS